MQRMNRLVIDSSQSITDLCELATEFSTDKSPFHVREGNDPHRHPYTAIYDFLFAGRRYDPLVFGELGILDNMSMHAWRGYFPNATLYGFDFFVDKLDVAIAHNLPRAHYAQADVTDRAALFRSFNDTRQMFDVLIDDSTHVFEHQIIFVDVAVEFVKPGGILVIEDVFSGYSDARYCDALQPYYRYFSSGLFIDAKHDQEFSGGWAVEPYFDNSRLIVLFRNQEPIARQHGLREANRRRLDATLQQPGFVERAAKG